MCARERPEPHLNSRYRPFAAKILLRARGFRCGNVLARAKRIPKPKVFNLRLNKNDFWERSGPTEGGGSTPQVCGRAPEGCTPPEGWCSRAAERSGECGAKRKIHAPEGCTHTHTCTVRIARTNRAHAAGRCTHTHTQRKINAPKVHEKKEKKKNNRTLRPARPRDRVKNVVHASRVRVCTLYVHQHPSGAVHIPHLRCGLRAAERSGECATKK